MKKGEWSAVVRLVKFLAAEGFSLHSASDGERRMRKSVPAMPGRPAMERTEAELIKWTEGAESGYLYFSDDRDPEAKRQTVFLVYGNAENGEEVVCDHSCVGRFDGVMDRWSASEEMRYADGGRNRVELNGLDPEDWPKDEDGAGYDGTIARGEG